LIIREMSPSVLDEDGQQTAARKTGAVDGVGVVATAAAAVPARPSNVKRARPLSQSTPPPEPVALDKRKGYEAAEIEHLLAVLAKFEAPEEESLHKSGETIAPHHMTEVEDLFALIARVGNPLLPWETLRPVFLWKIRHVMEESVRVERLIDARVKEERTAAGLDDAPPPPPPIHQVKGGVPYRPPAEGWEDDSSELRESYRFILGRAASLTAAPFTFQRVCELLCDPLRHYKKAEKLFHALEKCINVVTCVDDNGQRITGMEDEDAVEEEEMDMQPNGRIEARFFGRVDECDEPMDTTSGGGGGGGAATTEKEEKDNAASGAAGDSPESKLPVDVNNEMDA
ncbi:hypothetical protein PFISCL1PPCAC_22888, partial [Pristionchus fissidentatus]